jgi:hypothetical protein
MLSLDLACPIGGAEFPACLVGGNCRENDQKSRLAGLGQK